VEISSDLRLDGVHDPNGRADAANEADAALDDLGIERRHLCMPRTSILKLVEWIRSTEKMSPL
jgi:DNA-directed RNA polymerase subunit N (RpoN/RPB10)